MSYYVRFTAHPESDLARGYSYPMGEFGNEDEAHAGLSGFDVAWDGCAHLADYLERYGSLGGDEGFVDRETGRPVRLMAVLFAGGTVGTGPDNEDLFHPTRIIRAWGTRMVRDADHLEELVEAAIEQDKKSTR